MKAEEFVWLPSNHNSDAVFCGKRWSEVWVARQRAEEGSVESGGTLFFYLSHKADTDKGPLWAERQVKKPINHLYHLDRVPKKTALR